MLVLYLNVYQSTCLLSQYVMPGKSVSQNGDSLKIYTYVLSCYR